MKSFTDRTIAVSYYRVLALTFGVSGLACALVGAYLYLTGHSAVAHALHALTVPLIGAGAVMRIRSWFGVVCEQWTEAYAMGVEVGREAERESPVRSVLRD